MATHNNEWESSFKQVLNKTKANIQQISQRYSQSDVIELPLQPGARTLGSSSSGYGGNNNVNSNASSSPPMRSRQFQGNAVAASSSSAAGRNQISIDADTLNMILTRLAKLEERRLEGGETRLSTVEQQVDSLRKIADNTVVEVQDAQRATLQLTNQITRQGGLLEVLQQDVDARRSVVSRMDSWARQGEIWREDMEAQLVAINRQIKELSRQSRDHQTTLTETPSKFDMDALKNQMTILTQQSVAASLAAWHDKIEGSIRNVERQVAAVRIGVTASNAELSDEQVSAALVTPMPSELMVKALVDSAVRAMETSVEASVEQRVESKMRSQQADLMKDLKTEVRETVGRVASDAGLPVPGDGESAARQAMAQRKAQERELSTLLGQVETLQAAMVALQEAHEGTERHRATEQRALERRVDETSAVCSSTMVGVQARCSGLEEMVRSSELGVRTALSAARDEAQERLRDACAGIANDRVSLDRRLVLVERAAEDLVDKLKVSNSAIEAFFSSSQEGRRLQQAAARTELLSVELSNVKADLRDSAAAFARVEAQACRRADLNELRDRLVQVEPVVESHRRLEGLHRQQVEEVTRLAQRVQQCDQQQQLHSSSLQSLHDRLRIAESSSQGSADAATSAIEAAKLLGVQVGNLETAGKAAEKANETTKGSTASLISTLELRVGAIDRRLEGVERGVATATATADAAAATAAAASSAAATVPLPTHVPVPAPAPAPSLAAVTAAPQKSEQAIESPKPEAPIVPVSAPSPAPASSPVKVVIAAPAAAPAPKVEEKPKEAENPAPVPLPQEKAAVVPANKPENQEPKEETKPAEAPRKARDAVQSFDDDDFEFDIPSLDDPSSPPASKPAASAGNDKSIDSAAQSDSSLRETSMLSKSTSGSHTPSLASMNTLNTSANANSKSDIGSSLYDPDLSTEEGESFDTAEMPSSIGSPQSPLSEASPVAAKSTGLSLSASGAAGSSPDKESPRQGKPLIPTLSLPTRSTNDEADAPPTSRRSEKEDPVPPAVAAPAPEPVAAPVATAAAAAPESAPAKPAKAPKPLPAVPAVPAVATAPPTPPATTESESDLAGPASGAAIAAKEIASAGNMTVKERLRQRQEQLKLKNSGGDA